MDVMRRDVMKWQTELRRQNVDNFNLLKENDDTAAVQRVRAQLFAPERHGFACLVPHGMLQARGECARRRERNEHALGDGVGLHGDLHVPDLGDEGNHDVVAGLAGLLQQRTALVNVCDVIV